MPSFQHRRLDDGSPSVIALVRIKGFKSISKAFRDEQAAKAWATATEVELRRQRDRGASADTTRATIRSLCDAFLKDPKTTSLKAYDSLEALLAWWMNEHGHEKVMGFGIAKVRGARETLLDGERSPSTVNRYLSAMRSCWNWGRHSGLVANESAWPVKVMLAEPPPRVRFLDDGELKAVLKAAKKQPPWFNAAVVVSIGTGVRQGELLRLRWRDVDLKGRRIVVLETKNATPRAVHLPTAAVRALKALGRKHEPDDLVFPYSASKLIQMWEAMRTKVGLQNFRWHDFRHSCASYLAQGGASLLEIGSVLGHKSPSVTMRYAHLVQGAPLAAHSKLEGKLKR